MNMTMNEMIEALYIKNALTTYENANTIYVDIGFLVFLDGSSVNGFLKNDDTFIVEFEDTSANEYEKDDLVGVVFYRKENLI